MNKHTPFQKYLLEQSRRLGSSGISKGTPKLPRPTLQPREVPFRSGEDDEPAGPPKPDPASKLEPDGWWGDDDGIVPRPDFQSEVDVIEDGAHNILTYCAEGLKPWWMNADVWNEVMGELRDFFDDFPWDGTPEEQSQYLIDFINSLVFYDMNGDAIDMNEYVEQVGEMLLEWVQDMIEGGLDEFDDDGIEDIPNTEDIFDQMTPYMRYAMLQKLKALYNFLHGFIEDLESAG